VEFLTDFADEAVILPLAVMMAASLAVLGWWRGAVAWTIAVGGVLSLMLFLKILFVACAGPLSSLGIHSPSGHTAAAAVAYGGAVVLFGRGRMPLWLLVLIPPVIALLIGASRLVLHAHVPNEVFLGAAIGLAGVAVLVPLAGVRPPLRSWPVVAVALVVVLIFHGIRLEAEHTIYTIAMLSWLQLSAMCRV
jgi:membrane-associated phospholipid phosphatase